MTARQIVATVFFAVFWTAFMILWTGDYSTRHIVILSVTGVLVAAAWAFVMKRCGNWS
jgi:hypothetical protein